MRIAAPGRVAGLWPLRPAASSAAGLWPLRPAGCSQPCGRPLAPMHSRVLPLSFSRLRAHRPLPRATRFAVEATGEKMIVRINSTF